MSVFAKKSNDLSVLESIVKELELSESQRAELLTSLRKFNLSDDNDPVLKITLATGLMARYMSQLPDEMTKRFKLMCEALHSHFNRMEANSEKLDTHHVDFICGLRRQMDEGLKSLKETHNVISSIYLRMIDAQKTTHSLQEDVAREVKDALDHAKRLNDYNRDEESFRAWVGFGTAAAMLCAIAALIFSIIAWQDFKAERRHAEMTFTLAYELHKDKFPEKYRPAPVKFPLPESNASDGN